MIKIGSQVKWAGKVMRRAAFWMCRRCFNYNHNCSSCIYCGWEK